MGRLRWIRFASVGVVAMSVTTAGCATQTEVFLHKTHRENYAFQPGELQRMQFYISTNVLAHEVGNPQTEGTPAGVFVVERGTPGSVREVGPNWLRVSFGGGEGVVFLADPEQPIDANYWIATELEDSRGFKRVRDLDDKLVIVGGRYYRLAYGWTARLLVNSDDLQQAMALRARAPGREAR